MTGAKREKAHNSPQYFLGCAIFMQKIAPFAAISQKLSAGSALDFGFAPLRTLPASSGRDRWEAFGWRGPRLDRRGQAVIPDRCLFEFLTSGDQSHVETRRAYAIRRL